MRKRPGEADTGQSWESASGSGFAFSIRREKIYPQVAFVGESTFKTPMPENVTEGRGSIPFVKARRQPMFSDDEVRRIIGDIKQFDQGTSECIEGMGILGKAKMKSPY